jgi:hypothetical protein
VPYRFVWTVVQVTSAVTGLRAVLEIKRLEFVVHFDYVVLIASLGTDDIARFYIVFDALGNDFRPALEDEPIFMAIVEMAIERAAAVSRNAEDARRRYC